MSDPGMEAYAAARMMSHGAIAYSESTGRSGSTCKCWRYDEAVRSALQNCGEPDAVIVRWGRNCYLALAVGDDRSYGCATAETAEAAASLAIQECAKYWPNPRLALLFHTYAGPVELRSPPHSSPPPQQIRGRAVAWHWFGAVTYLFLAILFASAGASLLRRHLASALLAFAFGGLFVLPSLRQARRGRSAFSATQRQKRSL